MKAYNFTVSTLGIIFLLIILYSCSNDSVVTSSDYLQTPLNEVVWNPNSGGGDNGGTTACRSTATSTACPGTGGENTGGELVISGSKHCSWIDAGHRHTIFVKEDSLNDPNKTVNVRGYNSHSQLIQESLYRDTIIAPARKSDIGFLPGEVPIMLSGHRRHVCYQFNTSGAVKCYGENGNKAAVLGNQSGQILDGTHTYQSMKISAGRSHNAMLLSDGQITTFGSNFWGQLGTGDPYVSGVGIQEYPNAVTYFKIKDSNGNVSTPSDWTNVSSGHYHTCAIRNEEAWCAGKNTKGQTGNKNYTLEFQTGGGPGNYVFATYPDMVNISHGIKVEGLNKPVIIDGGESHSCAIQKNGIVKCWGDNSYGQLGDNSTHGDLVYTDPTVPTTVIKEDGSPLLAKALSLGEDTSCAIDIEDNLKCWGRNLHGLQGHGDNNPRKVATQVPGATNVKQADLTWHHLAWLKHDGSVWGAGQQSSKQLSDGSTDDVRTPIQLFTDVTATSRKHELFRTHNW
jgi:alpha-tubulin suppressor-like RCC1 family protein